MRFFLTGGRDYRPTQEEMQNFTIILIADMPTEIHHGDCRGVDRIVSKYAETLGFKTISHPANWYPLGRLDRSAGPRRNQLMVDLAQEGDILVAFRGGTGTADMKRRWKSRDLKLVSISNIKLLPSGEGGN